MAAVEWTVGIDVGFIGYVRAGGPHGRAREIGRFAGIRVGRG